MQSKGKLQNALHLRAERYSRRDIVSKWKRKLPAQVQMDLPFDLLLKAVELVSEDTKLNLSAIQRACNARDIAALFSSTSLPVDFTEYESPDLLLQDRLISDLFSKFPFPNSPFSTRDKAKLRFWEAENLCEATNNRLRVLKDADSNTVRLIDIAQREIKRILGSFDLDEMSRSSRFGPGACRGVGGAFTTTYFKYAAKEFTITSNAVPYAEALFNSDLFWKAHASGIDLCNLAGRFNVLPGNEPVLSVIDANKVTFVPKNAKTDRSIAIEPFFNIFFQLGIGKMIRQRLKRHAKIDLDSQTRNQMLAKIASVNGTLATVDFSMASDTLSIELVRLLLPKDWFYHLDNLRSKYFELDPGRSQSAHKFSSMGNGYTFELESLVFYALAYAASVDSGTKTDSISVFGDDVLIDVNAYECFCNISKYCGFIVNEEKTYFHGYFRESCGSDFLKGVSVRPVFCKELSTVSDVGSLTNRLSELNRSVGSGSRLNRVIDGMCHLLRSHIPRDVRKCLVGPPSETVDGYLFAERDRIISSPFVRYDRRLFAWVYPTVRFSPKSFRRSNSSYAFLMNDTLKDRNLFNNALRRWEYFDPIFGCVTHGELNFSVSHAITGRKVGNYVFGQSLAWSLGY